MQINEDVLTLLKDRLECLRNSCMEGFDGTWDCSTDEGREGFEPMAEDCEEIAKLLGITLSDYEV